MWKNLQSFFNADATLEKDQSGNVTSDEQIIAVLAVLIKVSRSDDEIGTFELERAIETVAKEFERDTNAITPLTEVSELLSKDEGKLERLIQNINHSFDVAQRIDIMKAVWKVIRADAKVTRAEASYAARLRTLLGLTLEQAAFASQSS